MGLESGGRDELNGHSRYPTASPPRLNGDVGNPSSTSDPDDSIGHHGKILWIDSTLFVRPNSAFTNFLETHFSIHINLYIAIRKIIPHRSNHHEGAWKPEFASACSSRQGSRLYIGIGHIGVWVPTNLWNRAMFFC